MTQTVLTDTLFSSFPLHPLLLQGIADSGFVRCTPIQDLALPIALSGRDVAGQAQTGTGKTAAFLVAVMNRLLTTTATPERKDSDPRALIIAPTRELAIQIEKDAVAIGRHTGLRMALIYGGVDYERQRQELREGCDIIIATPGRLLDYYKQHVFGLNGIEVMVIDEADRMFDLGFIKDVRYLFHRLPARERRQVLLFSATLSYRVLELAYEHMRDPAKIVVESDHVTADQVRQLVYFPAREEKLPLLLNLMDRLKPARSIVFVNTKVAAEQVTERLRRHGCRVGAVSGDVPQLKRQKLLQRFKAGQLDILVATDVAARGLHIPGVTHVFNYDLPHEAEDYVHRIGRTARLGEEGDAISFACDRYAIALPDIEAYIGQAIPVAHLDPELLVMPRPRAPDPEYVANVAADSASFGDVVPAHAGQPPRRGAAGGARRGPAPVRAGADPAAGARPRRRRGRGGVEAEAAPVEAGSTPAQGPAVGAPAQAAADTPARKPRRHRGGRGRRRPVEEGQANAVQADAGAPTSADAGARGSRRTSRPRAESSPTPTSHRPSRQVVVTEGAAGTHRGKKPGLFRRLTRLFTRH
ncbi:MAG: DEAD/DEAH box helicase [Xanthomonadales bacterium]|nr:DEAD/DEAH box helicase [Xanthomonadales bacterium]